MPKALDVVIDTQVSYLLPSQKHTYVPKAAQLILPGLEWLCTRNENNSVGVMFTENKFTPEEYEKSELKKEFPAHCLIGGLSGYDPVGVQNIFNQRLLVSRGVPVFHLHKKIQSMWAKDMWDNHATVHSFKGSSAQAYGLPEFIGTQLEGVKRVNIWGVAADGALINAIDGFLARKFKVNVISNLCRGRAYQISQLLAAEKYGPFKMDNVLTETVLEGDL